MNGLFIGAATTFTLIAACSLQRLPRAYFVLFRHRAWLGAKGLGIGAPVSAAISLCISLWYFLSEDGAKKIRRS
jgi:Na+-driven multidrug efflux pump